MWNVSGKSRKGYIKKSMLRSRTFFRKLSCILENVEKYTTRQATDDSEMWRMRFAYWITKATNTHS